MENPFVKLFAIDFKDHLEVKKSGSTELRTCTNKFKTEQ